MTTENTNSRNGSTNANEFNESEAVRYLLAVLPDCRIANIAILVFRACRARGRAVADAMNDGLRAAQIVTGSAAKPAATAENDHELLSSLLGFPATADESLEKNEVLDRLQNAIKRRENEKRRNSKHQQNQDRIQHIRERLAPAALHPLSSLTSHFFSMLLAEDLGRHDPSAGKELTQPEILANQAYLYAAAIADRLIES